MAKSFSPGGDEQGVWKKSSVDKSKRKWLRL